MHSSDPSKTPKSSPKSQLPRLLALARPKWRALALGTLFLAIGSAMGLWYPQLIRKIMDESLGPGGTGAVDRAALMMLGIFLVDGVATGLRYYTFTVTGERIVTELRQRLFRHILAQEIAFFDTRRTGELTNRLASDTTVLQNAVSVNISMALRSLASAIGGIGLLLYTSPKLTGLMLSIVPLVSIGAAVFGRRVRALARDTQDALATTGDVAEEVLSSMRTVRAFAAEAQEGTRYASTVDTAFEITKRRIRYVAMFSGGASFAAYGAIAVVLWYGGHLVIAGAMTVGELTAFLLYTLIVAFSLGTLGGLWSDFMRAIGATERVFELLERAPTMPTAGGATLAQVRGEIDLTHVTFAYPSRPDVQVLQDVSLHVAPGEVVALVGPSGAGKTTMAGLLTRMYDVNAGTVALDGTPLTTLSPDWLRQQVGSVAQEPVLFSTSIADNIRYGRGTASLDEVMQAARTANAHDFIAAFPQGYATPVGERGVQLSGGQKQRVAIARAVLKNPQILILDEATSALDAESEHLVKEALERLMQGRTTLIIAHRLSTVKDANRVIVMERGRIVQSGTHAALLSETSGLYRRLVERQFAK